MAYDVSVGWVRRTITLEAFTMPTTLNCLHDLIFVSDPSCSSVRNRLSSDLIIDLLVLRSGRGAELRTSSGDIFGTVFWKCHPVKTLLALSGQELRERGLYTLNTIILVWLHCVYKPSTSHCTAFPSFMVVLALVLATVFQEGLQIWTHFVRGFQDV